MKKIVVAALLFQHNRLLICQRNATGEFPLKWEFPGGKIESGEVPEAALRRELKEELAIEAEIGEEIWRVEYQYPDYVPVLLLFFGVRRYEGVIENRVFEQICWVPPQDLSGYNFLEADRILVGKLTTAEIIVPVCETPIPNRLSKH